MAPSDPPSTRFGTGLELPCRESLVETALCSYAGRREYQRFISGAVRGDSRDDVALTGICRLIRPPVAAAPATQQRPTLFNIPTKEHSDGEDIGAVLLQLCHVEILAQAVAEGARSAGAQITLKRVPELVPE